MTERPGQHSGGAIDMMLAQRKKEKAILPHSNMYIDSDFPSDQRCSRKLEGNSPVR